MKRVLVVEDAASIREMLALNLKMAGWDVVEAGSAERALELMHQGEPCDAALLDIMLPGMDGLSLCETIRRDDSDIGIIIVSAKGQESDKIRGLSIGADDYITKPFKLAVFLSRVNALLRRGGDFSQPDATLCSHGIEVERLARTVRKNGVPVELTASEYRLLCLFMENPGLVLTPDQILGKLWDCEENYLNNNTLTVYIRRLRAKIEDEPSAPQRIVTVRGMGYK
ncbi:MAG: response regulator transcription factor, partial [Blautia massiliensis (ex Durand et al. 2017)]